MRSRLPLFSRDSFTIPATRPQAANTANMRLKRGPMMRKRRQGRSGATKRGVPDPGPVGAIKTDPSTAKRSIPWANTNDCRPAVGVKVRRLCDLITETTNQQHASGNTRSSSRMKIEDMVSIVLEIKFIRAVRSTVTPTFEPHHLPKRHPAAQRA